MTVHPARALLRGSILFVHEAREQAPIAVTALAAALGIVQFVWLLSRGQTGEVALPHPLVVPSVLVVLTAFASAELFTRDRRTGLARVLAAAPVSRVHVLLPRLVCLACVVLALGSVARQLEVLPSESSQRPGAQLFAWTALSAVSTMIAGTALGSGLGAALFGGALGLGLIGLSGLSNLKPDNETQALAVVAVRAFVASTSTWVVFVATLAALWYVASPRHRARSARRAFGAMWLVLLPGAVPAGIAVWRLVRVPFEGSRGTLVTPNPSNDGAYILAQVTDAQHLGPRNDPFNWSSSWLIDTRTGERRRLPASVADTARWHSAQTLAYTTTGDDGVERQFTLDVESGETRALEPTAPAQVLGTVKVLRSGDELGPDGTKRQIYELQIRPADGSLPPPRWVLGWHAVDAETVYVVDLAGALDTYSLGDGAARHVCALELQGRFRKIRVSPGGRWLALQQSFFDAGKGVWSTTSLLDLTSGAVACRTDGAFHGWTTRSSPLIVDRGHWGPSGGWARHFVVVGVHGATPLEFADGASWVYPLGDDRWLVQSTREALDVFADDGTHLVSVRRGNEERR